MCRNHKQILKQKRKQNKTNRTKQKRQRKNHFNQGLPNPRNLASPNRPKIRTKNHPAKQIKLSRPQRVFSFLKKINSNPLPWCELQGL